jgi:hypothetical protein
MTAMVLMLSHGIAVAQDAVNARIGSHDGYARVVFDWPAATTYSVNQSGDRLEITFARPGTMNAGASADPHIKSLEQLVGGTAPLKVALTVAPGRKVRHFTVGNRVIVDVSDPNAKKSTATAAAQNPAQEKKEAEKKAAEKTVPEKSAAAEKPAMPEKTVPPASASGAPAMPAKAVAEVEGESIPEGESVSAIEKQAPGLARHTISVTTTEAVGMAAFERFGTLWIVVDRPGFAVPPVISGPEKTQFPEFHREDLINATVFSMKLPDDVGENIYGEGSGLVWRVVVDPDERMASPVLPQRTFDAAAEAGRGGTLTWPLRRVTKLVEIKDPVVGDTITAATVSDATQNGGPARDFVDLSMLNSPVGLAVAGKADDLKIENSAAGVKISRPDGLALSRVNDLNRQVIRQNVQEPEAPPAPVGNFKRIFDFDRWQMGGPEKLAENQHVILSGMGGKDKNGRVQDLLTLAKMNIANDRGQEALGFLHFAGQELPAIADSPEFMALRGAAEALAGKYELAWKDLSDPVLAPYNELDYWRAYTLAWLEDWRQAGEVMPADQTLLLSYPRILLEKMGIKLAEIALRKNEVPKAESIFAILDKNRAALKPWTQAALDYMSGQAWRQKGSPEKTRPLWEPLITGKDDFYRARAGLALTMLELDSGNIDMKQAIDRLEGLRYAWRGDELEAQINFTLGKLYIQNKEYMKGFTILRDAQSMRPESDISLDISAYMQQAFVDLLTNNKDLTPEDAVMVYEEFKNLTPETAEGNKMAQKLAERMVNADLMTRAAAILQHQVDFKIGGEEQARIAMRLGAVYLLDNDPKPAIAALEKAKVYYSQQPSDHAKQQVRNANLMHARALSQMNQTEEAIALLNNFPPEPAVNRLRADIAWNAGLWEDAAEAIQDLILDEAIDPARPLSIEQADLILNRAVALNLSGNRVALTNMQKRYGDAMQKTARARLFDIVTRPRKTSIIADRDTIEQIVSEVDLFKDFLNDYKQTKDLGTN